LNSILSLTPRPGPARAFELAVDTCTGGALAGVYVADNNNPRRATGG